jgi:hypothetical protein
MAHATTLLQSASSISCVGCARYQATPRFKPRRLLSKRKLRNKSSWMVMRSVLGMRLFCCDFLGIQGMESERRTLMSMQCDDGGWPVSSFVRFGVSGLEFGNRGLSTALAVNAIRAA